MAALNYTSIEDLIPTIDPQKIQEIDRLIVLHTAELQRLQKLKEALSILASLAPDEDPDEDSDKFSMRNKAKVVFETVNRLLLMRELMEEMHKLFPDKQYADTSAFSGQFSNVLKRKTNIFHRIEFPEHPSQTRFYYGLKIWFNPDGSPKPEYVVPNTVGQLKIHPLDKVSENGSDVSLNKKEGDLFQPPSQDT